MLNLYIGETIRRLGSRLKEHKDACRKCEKDKSALAEHAWDEGHPIAWEKVRILNSENRRIRLVKKEALHINESKSTLMNRYTGLELPGCWLATLSHFTHAILELRMLSIFCIVSLVIQNFVPEEGSTKLPKCRV